MEGASIQGSSASAVSAERNATTRQRSSATAEGSAAAKGDAKGHESLARPSATGAAIKTATEAVHSASREGDIIGVRSSSSREASQATTGKCYTSDDTRTAS